MTHAESTPAETPQDVLDQIAAQGEDAGEELFDRFGQALASQDRTGDATQRPTRGQR